MLFYFILDTILSMNLFKHRRFFTVAAFAVAAILVSGFIATNIYKQQRLANISKNAGPEHKYDKLVTQADLKPLPMSSNGKTVKIPILMYHHIGTAPADSNATRKDLTVSVENFEGQAAWLKTEGYTSILLADVYQYSLGKFTLPQKPVIFTFDDGYADIFQNAIPILDKYGFKGSFAIITQYPSRQQGDNLYASWQDIAKAYDSGQEIISHTQDHFDGSNPKFSADFILKNLTGSVADIKDRLNFTSNILIYPYGHYSANYIKLAKTAGFVMGITVHEGSRINLDNLMEVPRIRVHGNEPLEKFKELILE